MPSDFVRRSPFPEVLLVGAAYAPKVGWSPTLDVRLTVGAWSKSLRVVGARANGTEQRWSSMPLVYERAAGGPTMANPVGVESGMANIESPDPNKMPGFGPLATTWPARRSALGDAKRPPKWDELANASFPAGFSLSFYQSAPPDQWLEALPPWIELALVHLHPDIASLKTRLPALAMQAVEVRQGTSNMVNLVADTIWIHTDRAVATVTYRATMSAHSDDMHLSLAILPKEGWPFADDAKEAEPATDELAKRPPPSPQGAGLAGFRPHASAPAVRRNQTSTYVDVAVGRADALPPLPMGASRPWTPAAPPARDVPSVRPEVEASRPLAFRAYPSPPPPRLEPFLRAIAKTRCLLPGSLPWRARSTPRTAPPTSPLPRAPREKRSRSSRRHTRSFGSIRRALRRFVAWRVGDAS